MDVGAGLLCAHGILMDAGRVAPLLPSAAAGPSGTGSRLLFDSLQDMPTRVDKSDSSTQFH